MSETKGAVMTASVHPERDRIFSLDAIRGVAVMGIFSVNVIAFAMIEAAYFNPAAYGGHHGINLFVWAANMLVIDGKMRALFSMLFGASTLLVIERAEAANLSGANVHYRRMLVLLGIGLIHYFFIWFGDILVLYAISGMLAFFVRNRPVNALVTAGILLMLVHMMFFGFFVFQQAHADAAAHTANASAEAINAWNGSLGYFYPFPAEIAKDLAIHRGGFIGIAAQKFVNWQDEVTDTLIFIPETVGLMMFGMAGYKSGFLTGEWSDRSYRLVAATLIPFGLAAGFGVVWTDIGTNFFIIAMMTGFVVVATPFITFQAVGYAALIILLVRKMGPLAQRVAAAGRCAFTNYLGTSLIAAFVFYGWGLSYYGSVSRAQAWLLVPCVWTVMLLWSKPWLERFRYGPLEWLWRSLSRGARQPMRRPTRTVGT